MSENEPDVTTSMFARGASPRLIVPEASRSAAQESGPCFCSSRSGFAPLLFLLALLTTVAGTASGGELLPLTGFYDTPTDLEAGFKAGDLIRAEPLEEFHLPEGARGWRMLYASTDSHGATVAVSGAVIVPPGEPPADGWPIVAWAHGTSGSDRSCAPSLMPEVFSDYEAPIVYLEQGFAVVATDYAGLGSDSPIEYLDRIGNAWNVIHGVAAARAAVSGLGPRWLAAGHSAGAHTMRGVAELQHGENDPGYLGAASVSGLGDRRAPVMFLSARSAGLALYVLESVRAASPQFEPGSLLTDAGVEWYESARRQCAGPGVGFPPTLRVGGAEVLQDGWADHPLVEAYFERDETGTEQYRGPLLVINGSEEPPSLFKNDYDAVRSACERGAAVQFVEIPGANHISVLMESIDVQLSWIKARFAGESPPTNCSELAVSPAALD